MTRIGTCYFTDRYTAEMYYKPYHYQDTAKAVTEKIKSGEICIGSPPKMEGETSRHINSEGRWEITTK